MKSTGRLVHRVEDFRYSRRLPSTRPVERVPRGVKYEAGKIAEVFMCGWIRSLSGRRQE